MALIGSPSAPLTTTTGRRPLAVRSELDRGRERRAAPPTQAGGLDVGEQAVGRRQAPVHRLVVGQPHRHVRHEAGEQPRLGHPVTVELIVAWPPIAPEARSIWSVSVSRTGGAPLAVSVPPTWLPCSASTGPL